MHQIVCDMMLVVVPGSLRILNSLSAPAKASFFSRRGMEGKIPFPPNGHSFITNCEPTCPLTPNPSPPNSCARSAATAPYERGSNYFDQGRATVVEVIRESGDLLQ
jgi:hypothetical protein